MLHCFHGISLLTYVWCESSLGEGRVDMFSRHFFADVCVPELSLGGGRVTMFSRHFFANVLCVSIRVSCGSLTAPRFECLLYFAVC